MEKPVISSYHSYRDLLRDLVEYKKSKRKTFSYRLLSKLTEVSSPNFYQLVIQGKRNLNDELAQEVARVLGLSDDEVHYFVILVRHERAKDSDELLECERQLQRIKAILHSRKLTDDELPLLSSWHKMVLRGLVTLNDFSPDSAWIRDALLPLLPADEVVASLDSLQEKGVISRDEQGKYKVEDEILDTYVARVDMRGFCIETMEMWKKLLENRTFKDDDLKYYLMTLTVPSVKVTELRNKLENLLNEISGWSLDSKSGPQDRLMQIGLFMIPLTKQK